MTESELIPASGFLSIRVLLLVPFSSARGDEGTSGLGDAMKSAFALSRPNNSPQAQYRGSGAHLLGREPPGLLHHVSGTHEGASAVTRHVRESTGSAELHAVCTSYPMIGPLVGAAEASPAFHHLPCSGFPPNESGHKGRERREIPNSCVRRSGNRYALQDSTL